ncbi:PQQ-binding-like beta-propeller repeat protein [Natrialba sp. PRR66]|uniref:outer membrane protein assembly factor BamB family protein n=1 Tax=Natrialba sp. PRR66 TaxID=3098146 RepID=UPI002B1DB2C4|nr:PQQ-binding-like beta-propeller repeat protein [Natrialba sp. PRR66]
MPSNATPPAWRRREFIATASLSLGALAGCSTVRTELRERRLGEPDRRLSPDWHPDPGQWPMEGYNFAQTSHNPYATPPRDEPEIAWTYEHENGQEQNSLRTLIVADDTVYVRTDGELVALDAATGQTQWTKPREDRATLAFIAGRLYEFREDQLRALTPGGESIWETEFDDDNYYYTPLERDGWVYATGRDTVARLHADTGDIITTADLDAASPITAGGPVYAGRYSLTAYDIVDAEFSPRWTVDDGFPYESYGSTAVANGLVVRSERHNYAGDGEDRGRLSIYDVTDGTRRTELTTARTTQSPSVDGQRVYVSTSDIRGGTIGSAGQLAAFSVDGEERWRYEPEAGLQPPVSADGTVYVGPFANDRVPLVAFDAATGDELWRRDVASSLELAIAGETLYVGTNESVRALRA